MTLILCYSFFGDKMKIFKNVGLLISIAFIIVLIFGYFYLKNQVMISESVSLNVDDIIGYINIDSINLTNNLMQGYDNDYYLNHDYLKKDSLKGEFFLDYEGDLINNNNSIIYSKVDNIINYNNLKIGDKIEVLYLKDKLCYQIIDFNSKKLKNYDLLIKIYDKNIKFNILSKKIMC